jgi:hypothetical protein
MKKIVLLITLFVLSVLAASAAGAQSQHAKKDTVRDLQSQPKPRAVKGKRARMAMQLRQIQRHEKELKKVHKADRELQKEKQASHQLR